MSVTFTFAQYVEDPEYGTILVNGTSCQHECTLSTPCDDFDFYRICDHSVAARDACGCQDFDVDFSNTNARMVLERLGLPVDAEDLAGSIDPDDLLGRALTANVGRDDDGISSVIDREPGCATMVYAGVRPGYFSNAMDQLARLATEAKSRETLVGWA